MLPLVAGASLAASAAADDPSPGGGSSSSPPANVGVTRIAVRARRRSVFKEAKARVAFDLPIVKTKKRSDLILLPAGTFKSANRTTQAEAAQGCSELP